MQEAEIVSICAAIITIYNFIVTHCIQLKVRSLCHHADETLSTIRSVHSQPLETSSDQERKVEKSSSYDEEELDAEGTEVTYGFR